jgi:hypothetical protein
MGMVARGELEVVVGEPIAPPAADTGQAAKARVAGMLAVNHEMPKRVHSSHGSRPSGSSLGQNQWQVQSQWKWVQELWSCWRHAWLTTTSV